MKFYNKKDHAVMKILLFINLTTSMLALITTKNFAHILVIMLIGIVYIKELHIEDNEKFMDCQSALIEIQHDLLKEVNNENRN